MKGQLIKRWTPKPRTIWLLLMALSVLSTVMAEGFDHAVYAVVAIFVIAAAKADLVIVHYMEAGRAEPHWKFMYRAWLGIVTVLLIGGHIAS
jgi:caa(3)-type oxidase subunit IV